MARLLYVEASPGVAKAFDLQKRYMEQFLGFIGFTDITPIVVEPTLGKPESVERTKAEAAARARSAAGAF